MPRYCYRCESCEQEFIAFHSISETKDGCDLCGHESVKKMLSKPVVIRKNKKDRKNRDRERMAGRANSKEEK